MNQRIRELAEQASLYAVSDNSSMLFDVWKKRYTEKFAELIVRECGAVAYKAYWKNPESIRGRHIEEQIRTHFGVE